MQILLENLTLSKTLMRLVDKSSLSYLSLKDSIREYGILTALTVKKVNESKWMVIAGATRYMCAVDLELNEVPCIEIDVEDSEILMVQIQENSQRRNPNWWEYSQAVRNYLAKNPNLTFDDFCARVKKSPEWVMNILKLSWLSPDAIKMLKDRKISLQDATALRVLPEELQQEMLPIVGQIPSREFVAKCRQITRDLRDVKNADKVKKFFQVVNHQIPYVRAFGQIHREREKPSYFDKVITEKGITDPKTVWEEAIKWVLQIDDVTIQERKDRWQALNEKAYKQHLKRETNIKENQ